jgi:hypothetical protein
MASVLEIMNSFAAGNDRILVDSPPGAGKTYLVEAMAAKAIVDAHWRVGVGTTTRNQRNDLALRFRRRFPTIPIQVLLKSDEPPPNDLVAANVPTINRVNHLGRNAGVVISTVHRHFYTVDRVQPGARGLYDLIIADEAYQVQYRNGGLPLDALARNRLMVGDPGQISPFTELDTEIYESAVDRILAALPTEVLRNGSVNDVMKIDTSRRLPPDTVAIIQPALYPNHPFKAISTDAERRIAFANPGIRRDSVDRALDLVADGASIVAIQLPDAGFEIEVDDDIANLAVEIAERIHKRRARWIHEARDININSDIFYMDSHVNSVTNTQTRLASKAISLRADTPNVIQGQETLISIVKHPLSSMQEADPFHLDPGRLCVMLSRHKLACVILVRGDITTVLDDYQHDAGERLLGREDVTWRGYSAHRQVWNALISTNRVVS